MLEVDGTPHNAGLPTDTVIVAGRVGDKEMFADGLTLGRRVPRVVRGFVANDHIAEDVVRDSGLGGPECGVSNVAMTSIAADRDYPLMITEADHVEPVPRRVRATLGGVQIFDTTRARYVWEWAYYPRYYIPVEHIDQRFLVDEDHGQRLRQGNARRHGLRAGGLDRPGTVRLFGDDAINGVAGTARFEWNALDAWYEEDEQVFVHPRNPYVRVDALRSHRHVRASLDGITLAETGTPVLVFETGLPTRYYFDRTDVAFRFLVPTATRTACPYKGLTSGYWSVRTGSEVREGREDLAWAYDFPTRQVQPIAGLIAFYNEKIDLDVDGQRLPRPKTHFFT